MGGIEAYVFRKKPISVVVKLIKGKEKVFAVMASVKFIRSGSSTLSWLFLQQSI